MSGAGADEAAAEANGSAAEANGSAAEANGSATEANGSATEANAFATAANGSATEANGSATEANGKILTSNALSGHSIDMGEPAKRIATYADIKTLAPNLVGEIVDGELYTMPRPSPRHSNAQISLGTWLQSKFRFGDGGPGGWWILPEPEFHLHEHVLVPDLAGWRRERMGRLPDEAFVSLTPDWVCEILSPLTQAFDRIRKMACYGREGVPFVWLLDPLARSLEAFQWVEGRWTVIALHEGNEQVRVAPFEAVVLPLELLWAD